MIYDYDDVQPSIPIPIPTPVESHSDSDSDSHPCRYPPQHSDSDFDCVSSSPKREYNSQKETQQVPKMGIIKNSKPNNNDSLIHSIVYLSINQLNNGLNHHFYIGFFKDFQVILLVHAICCAMSAVLESDAPSPSPASNPASLNGASSFPQPVSMYHGRPKMAVISSIFCDVRSTF